MTLWNVLLYLLIHNSPKHSIPLAFSTTYIYDLSNVCYFFAHLMPLSLIPSIMCIYVIGYYIIIVPVTVTARYKALFARMYAETAGSNPT
jgi:hypothetical protein